VLLLHVLTERPEKLCGIRTDAAVARFLVGSSDVIFQTNDVIEAGSASFTFEGVRICVDFFVLLQVVAGFVLQVADLADVEGEVTLKMKHQAVLGVGDERTFVASKLSDVGVNCLEMPLQTAHYVELLFADAASMRFRFLMLGNVRNHLRHHHLLIAVFTSHEKLTGMLAHCVVFQGAMTAEFLWTQIAFERLF